MVVKNGDGLSTANAKEFEPRTRARSLKTVTRSDFSHRDSSGTSIPLRVYLIAIAQFGPKAHSLGVENCAPVHSRRRQEGRD
jgi:hypothetical protein